MTTPKRFFVNLGNDMETETIEPKQKLREVLLSIFEAIFSVLPEPQKSTLLLYFGNYTNMLVGLISEDQALKILIGFEETVCSKVCNCGEQNGHSN